MSNANISDAVGSTLVKMQKAADSAGDTDQLDHRTVGITVGDGIQPPYDPSILAGFQELNGTHAIAIEKKAQREVGFGFELVPHPRAGDNPSEQERELVEDFWYGRTTKWKTGPKGTPAATPTEVLEKGRKDFHGIGWKALEIMYAGYDDDPAGMAYLPAKTTRVKRSKQVQDNERVAGHGYVQKRNGETVYFAEAGDRQAEDLDGNPDPTYVDKDSGDVYDSREALENAGGAPANELLFVPNLHAQTLYYGLPAWIAEIQTMIADQEARRFNRKRVENDLMLDYVVIVEGGTLNEDARSDVREHIEGLRKGDEPGAWILDAEELTDSPNEMLSEGNASNVKIRVEPMAQFGEEDMSFERFREMNEKDIAKVHEVPLQVLGHHDATNSNSEEAIREFTQEVIKPAQERFAERLYRVVHQQILGVSDWTIEFVTKGGTDEKRQTEIAAQTINAVGSAMTVNQALGMFGMEPRDDTIGEMLLSEVGGGGGMGEVIQQEISDRVDDAVADVEAAARIQRGATADD